MLIKNFPNYDMNESWCVTNLRTGKVLNQWSNGKGDKYVTLYNGKHKKHKKITSLAEETFGYRQLTIPKLNMTMYGGINVREV